MKLIVPIIYNKSGQPVERASVRLNIGTNLWAGNITDSNGTCNILVDDSLNETQFECYSCDYHDYGTHINLGIDGEKQIRVGLAQDPDRPQDVILPPLEPLQPNAPTREQVCGGYSGFQGLNDSWNHPIWPSFWFNTDDATYRDWLNVFKVNNVDHVVVPISGRYAPYPYAPGKDWIKAGLGGFVEQCWRSLENGIIPIISLASDGQYYNSDGWTYGWQWGIKNLEQLAKSFEHLIDYCMFIGGYELVTPPGGNWTPIQFEQYTIQMANVGFKYIGAEIGSYLWWGDSNPQNTKGPEGDWNGPVGQLIDTLFLENNTPFQDPVDDADTFNGVEQAASRLLNNQNVLKRNQGVWNLGPMRNGNRIYWYLEFAAYQHVRGLYTPKQYESDVAFLKSYGFTSVG